MWFGSVSLVTIVLLRIVNCQVLLEHEERSVSNNSFIWYLDIGDKDFAMKCMTDNITCCNDSSAGNWTDVKGTPVAEIDDDNCLYVTRGDGVISLKRKSGCRDHTSGLWRCDIPDSSGEMQSLYIYISNDRSYGKNNSRK